MKGLLIVITQLIIIVMSLNGAVKATQELVHLSKYKNVKTPTEIFYAQVTYYFYLCCVALRDSKIL